MQIPTITIYDRSEFRKWLKKNHKKEKKVAIILYKRHTGKSAPSHRELMEEAICFGWIDTTVKGVDENTYIRHFSKRNEKSTWSKNTLGYARQLIKEGKMAEQGMHFFKLGKVKKTHDHGIPKNPDIPEELKKALEKNKKTKKKFDELLTPSIKKMLYRWFLSAKLPETRKKRIKQIITAVLSGDRDVIRPGAPLN